MWRNRYFPINITIILWKLKSSHCTPLYRRVLYCIKNRSGGGVGGFGGSGDCGFGVNHWLNQHFIFHFNSRVTVTRVIWRFHWWNCAPTSCVVIWMVLYPVTNLFSWKDIGVVGYVPMRLFLPILQRCSHKQLQRIEELNPYLLEYNDGIWRYLSDKKQIYGNITSCSTFPFTPHHQLHQHRPWAGDVYSWCGCESE